MHVYTRKVHYYETDRMGITHHSNYIRWMEEARMSFLDAIGFGMKKLEALGVTSPVLSVECRYKSPTTYDDLIEISVFLRKYTGATLEVGYEMRNAETRALVLVGSTAHCFIDENMRPVPVRRALPDFDRALREIVQK